MSTPARAAETGNAHQVASPQSSPAETTLLPDRSEPTELAATLHQAQRAPQSLTPSAVLRLQRSVGNRAVTRLLAARGLAAPPAAGPIMRAPKKLKFSAASFTPGSSGAITVTTGAAGPGISSAAYASNGQVKSSGGTDADAADWQAGYIQTIRGSAITARYTGSKANKKRSMTVSVPKRDALDSGGAPWYDPNNSNGNGKVDFTKTGETLAVNLWDKPSFPEGSFPWDTPDGKGKLASISGKDIFTAWMIARKKTAPNTIKYLKWETWHMDYGATFNYASTGVKTLNKTKGKTKHTGSGSGRGATSPTLSGTIANNAITLAWV